MLDAGRRRSREPSLTEWPVPLRKALGHSEIQLVRGTGQLVAS